MLSVLDVSGLQIHGAVAVLLVYKIKTNVCGFDKTTYSESDWSFVCRPKTAQ